MIHLWSCPWAWNVRQQSATNCSSDVHISLFLLRWSWPEIISVLASVLPTRCSYNKTMMQLYTVDSLVGITETLQTYLSSNYSHISLWVFSLHRVVYIGMRLLFSRASVISNTPRCRESCNVSLILYVTAVQSWEVRTSRCAPHETPFIIIRFVSQHTF